MTMTMTKTHKKKKTKTQTKTKTKTKTNTKTVTKTKCIKDPSHAIFSKSREFKDIRYDAYNDKDNCQDKDKENGVEKTQHMLYF